MRIRGPTARSGDRWPIRLVAFAFALLLMSFTGTALAGDCFSGSRARDGAEPSSCCAEANCPSGGCSAQTAQGDCILRTHPVVVHPAIAGTIKKACAYGGSFTVPSGDPRLVHLSRRPLPIRAQPPGIARYADIYARTGRLLI